MRFVEINKARGLKMNEAVFIRVDGNEVPAVGKMIERKETKGGLVITFEIAAFSEDFNAEGRTIIDNATRAVEHVPYLTTSVTHVAIP